MTEKKRKGPKPFVVKNPEHHDAEIWIGEAGEEHPAPSGWIYEDTTPPRFVSDDPAAAAHATRAYHMDTKVGGYSPFDEWSKGEEQPDYGGSAGFQEEVRKELEARDGMARDIVRSLPEDEWPQWVKTWMHDQVWGKPQPIKLPNPPSPMDTAQGDLTLPEGWDVQAAGGGYDLYHDDVAVGWYSHRVLAKIAAIHKADASLDASSDNWWGPQSVNMNQVDVPGEADGLQDGSGIPGAHVATDQNWMYLNGKVAFGGHWWDLAHRLAIESGLPQDQAAYISNSIARNAMPDNYDVAIGEIRGTYPQIWMSTCDRNAVWDEVSRELHNKQ